jgi:hypothetical protein
MAPKSKVTTKKPADNKAAGNKFRVACKAGLLTYNDPAEDVDLVEMSKELKEKFTADIHLSLCVEKESRLHVHVFFESDSVIDCDLAYFETTKSGKPGDFKANRGKNVDRGHWYVQCEWKKSHITCEFDRLIKPAEKWVMDEWKNDKIEKVQEALAAYKLLKPQLQQQIQSVMNYQEKEKVNKLLCDRDLRIQETMKKFAKFTSVEEWRAQYVVEQLRYKFLVLCGPSKLRKTEFAKSLFPKYHHHKDKIDWDGYSWLDNGSVIFDDINLPDHIWKYVRQNKVLFQASSIVAVNTSATNCYKRDVCVVQKPIIICTNDGLLDNFVSAPYREWIEANSVWVDVAVPIPFKDEVPEYYLSLGPEWLQAKSG